MATSIKFVTLHSWLIGKPMKRRGPPSISLPHYSLFLGLSPRFHKFLHTLFELKVKQCKKDLKALVALVSNVTQEVY